MSVTSHEIRDIVTKVADDNIRLHKQLLDIRADQASDAVKVQAAHDRVYRKFGDLYMEGTPVPFFQSQAPAPLAGESPTQYKKRSLENLKPYSPSYKADNLADYNGPALDKAEAVILREAESEAAKPTPACLPADGTMLVRARKDDTGIARYKERYSSKPGKTWDQFKSRTFLVKRWGDEKTGQDAFKL